MIVGCFSVSFVVVIGYVDGCVEIWGNGSLHGYLIDGRREELVTLIVDLEDAGDRSHGCWRREHFFLCGEEPHI